MVYTYDFQSDKELTNKELLAMNMMTEDEFVAEVCCLQEADFSKEKVLTRHIKEGVNKRKQRTKGRH